eukprot:TRINITY_DN31225_c0_g1_i1.p1 TRINITY_DN31225_c0_g1~~TRINITY_DN31225_c0_g1_i1.p1  ORF type:complete len:591 (+),score=144.40 TRINITY_DN31225_c0_g1_i1:182-1774(+)
MGLFYFVKFPDVQVRKYTYMTINQTLSIFCAVLTFSSINDVFISKYKAYTESLIKQNSSKEEADQTIALVFLFVSKFLVVVFFYWVFQSFMTRVALVKKSPKERKEAIDNRVRLNDIKSWLQVGVVFAHMTAFAGMSFVGGLQCDLSVFSKSPLASLKVVPISIVSCSILLFLSIGYHKRMMPEGELDELQELYIDVVNEGGNDILGLLHAFIVVQMLRFAIAGKLPNAEGEEEGDGLFQHSIAQILALYGCAAAFLVCLYFYLGWVVRREEREEEEKKKEKEEGSLKENLLEETEEAKSVKEILVDRLVETGICFLNIGFAWCFIYATQWFLAALGWTGDDREFLGLFLAVVISMVAFAFIYFCDLLADQTWTGKTTDKILRHMIEAYSVMLGFSWEQSFDLAVAAVGEHASHPTLVKSVLSIMTVIIVVPAWVHYIAPMQVSLGYRFLVLPQEVISRAKMLVEDEQTEEGKQLRLKQYRHMLRVLTMGYKELCDENDTYWKTLKRLWKPELDSDLHSSQLHAGYESEE